MAAKERKRMAKAELDVPKRKRGRPKGGGGVPRIHIVKQWKAEPDANGNLADKVNRYLGDRSQGDPRVVEVYPVNVGTPLMREEHAVVVIERDERRKEPGKGARWKYVDRRRNGGPEQEPPIEKE